MGDTDGQGTEVVQGRDLDDPGVHRVNDARNQAEPDAVTQFGVFETQVANLLEHGATVGVAVGIPTSGQGVHVFETDRPGGSLTLRHPA